MVQVLHRMGALSAFGAYLVRWETGFRCNPGAGYTEKRKSFCGSLALTVQRRQSPRHATPKGFYSEPQFPAARAYIGDAAPLNQLISSVADPRNRGAGHSRIRRRDEITRNKKTTPALRNSALD